MACAAYPGWLQTVGSWGHLLALLASCHFRAGERLMQLSEFDCDDKDEQHHSIVQQATYAIESQYRISSEVRDFLNHGEGKQTERGEKEKTALMVPSGFWNQSPTQLEVWGFWVNPMSGPYSCGIAFSNRVFSQGSGPVGTAGSPSFVQEVVDRRRTRMQAATKYRVTIRLLSSARPQS
jgi:hypothetical protein